MFTRWFARALAMAAAAGALLMALVWAVDPYVYFRKPGFFRHTYASSNARQMLPGMLRHCEYDSLVVGNSQSQNFSIAELRETLGWRAPLKATVPASYPAAMRRFLELAFERREVADVLIGMTLTQYRAPPEHIDRPLDDWLYAPRWTTLHRYLMNSGVAFEHAPKNALLTLGVAAPRALRRSEPDAMFTLDFESEKNDFNADIVRRMFILRGGSVNAAEKQPPDAARYMESARVNHLDIIDAQPGVKFIVALLPLPHVEWHKMRAEGCVDAMLEFAGEMAREFLARPNVAFYDFATVPEFAMDLGNFRDLAHFSPAVASAMIRHIANGEHRVTLDNIGTMVERMRWMSLPENVPDWAVEAAAREGKGDYSAFAAGQ
ncbi:MAG: hypothetical protein FWF96_02045 [Kiritimatiellaeota bacterium]|nr:hypothetical protein [Kiritimatiellota bacterium]